MRITTRERIALDFDTFSYCGSYELFLEPEDWDVSGGRMTIEEIDILKKYPYVKHLAISGLQQDTFEYFVDTYGNQFEAICFWKNKLVSDWSALSKLENVEYICYFFNQRIERLWDMSKNKKLKYLNIDDFSRLKDYSGIEKAPALEGLNFGTKVWTKKDLLHLPNLQNTKLRKIIHNGNVSMDDTYNMLQAPFLEKLDFSTNTYPTEFLAWICANYPRVEGYSLKPYIENCDGTITITGKKKKACVDVSSDKGKKIKEKAIADFQQMVSVYKGITFEEIVNLLDNQNGGYYSPHSFTLLQKVLGLTSNRFIASTAVILSALHSLTTASKCSLSIFIFWRP